MMMMMGPQATQASSISPSTFPPHQLHHLQNHNMNWVQELKSEERGLLIIQLLLKCAGSVSANHMEYTNYLLEQLSLLTSFNGDPIQRVASHFMEGLAARMMKSWPGLYKALSCPHLPSSSELVSCRQLFFLLCPYLKFAFTLVNHSILEAMEREKVVHIIDLGASEAIQWITMLQMLSTRAGGPPHLRITIINDRKEVLEKIGQELSEKAESLDIPFQFHPVVAKLEDVRIEMLRVKTGEAVAVSAVLRLHCLLMNEDFEGGSGNNISATMQNSAGAMLGDLQERERSLREFFEKEGSVVRHVYRQDSASDATGVVAQGPLSGFSKADGLLRMLRGISPKVMVIMEGEASMNGGGFMDRFVEALHYYGAIFDSLEGSLPGKFASERLTLERHMFGRAIGNIVSCEGSERVERQERLPRWIKRLQLAGFVQAPLSYASLIQVKRILASYTVTEGYKLVESNGCLTVCWQDTPLFSASAWQA
ncbi:hypothetical protein KP509_25G050600 [Ceratopteris richardii]|nr:hypothetical protein KP509_25G050600 [Ceratopteris richardii]